MQQAINLAKNNYFDLERLIANQHEIISSFPLPNPRVGCILVKNGAIIGCGFHHEYGQPHAEVMALKDAEKNYKTNLIVGCTAYVTLEPCSHFGKTPPCVGALIAHRVAKVVIAVLDANPQISSCMQLKKAKIDVKLNVLAEQAVLINQEFFKAMIRKIPWVSLKIASDLQENIAIKHQGKSQKTQITNAQTKKLVHKLRGINQAVLTGINTVLIDDPKFNSRLCEVRQQPILIVLDTNLRITEGLNIFTHQEKILIFCANTNSAQAKARVQNMSEKLEIIEVEMNAGKLNLEQILHTLWERKIYKIMIEAGCEINTNFMELNLIDEVFWFQTNKTLAELDTIKIIKDKNFDAALQTSAFGLEKSYPLVDNGELDTLKYFKKLN